MKLRYRAWRGRAGLTTAPLPSHVVDDVLDLLADAILEDFRAHPEMLDSRRAEASARRGVSRVTVGPPRRSVSSRAAHTPAALGAEADEEGAGQALTQAVGQKLSGKPADGR